ncbi:MAG: glutamate 5-kinase, partial [Bacteroides sp.]|nr:glutamate 5-kinase [Bacteroides sp.]
MNYQYTKVAVKIGSNVLTRKDGTLDITRMSALVDQVAELHKAGVEIVLVSSGAVASGRSEIKPSRKLDSVDQRQLFSAVGQAKLINRYYELFREHGISVGQVLTTKESFGTRRHYLNQRNCMQVMLENGVIPIVNENVTISVTELMFTDNDELSGMIASMMDMQALIILSNIDGIYNGSPSKPGTSVIREVEQGKDLSDYIQAEKSGFGRGGMLTKTTIARKVADEGIAVIIANGKKDNILIDILQHPEQTVCTRFIPAVSDVSSVKKWIAHSEGFAK